MVSLRLRLATFFADVPTPDRAAAPLQATLPAPASAERIYCDVARARLQDQLDAAASFDTKASAMLSIGSTILPITAGLLANNHQVIKDHPASGVALVCAVLAYIVLVGAFLKSYRLSKWDDRPNMVQWKAITPGRTDEEVYRWLGDACVQAYEDNMATLARKGKYASAVLLSLSVETVSLAIAVAWPLASHFVVGHVRSWF